MEADKLQKILEERDLSLAKEAKLQQEIRQLQEENKRLTATIKKITSTRFDEHATLFKDILQNNSPEEAIEAQRVFFEKILNNIPADITVYNTNKQYLYLNPIAVKNPEMRRWLIGKTDLDLSKVDSRLEIVAQNRSILFDSAVYDKEQKEWEEEWINEDGGIEFRLRKICPVFDNEGNFQMMIGYGINITKRILDEKELRESEELYRLLVQEAKGYGIFMLDEKGCITSWNEGAYKISGYQEEEVIGKHYTMHLPTGEHPTAPQDDYKLLIAKEEGKHEEEGWRRKKDGTLFWGNVIITPLYNFQNRLIGFSKIVRDLSERKKAEETLNEMRERAEASALAKQHFLANMSHEIRTPMNAIMGMSKMLAQGELDEKQTRFVNAILLSAGNLLKVIEDILDFSKIEAGQISIRETDFQLEELLKHVIQIFQSKVDEKGIKLKLDIDANLYNVLISDRIRINQIMLNLIGNAVKFTEKGQVDVSLKVLKDNADSQLIEVVVKDTGIGIPDEKLPYIFEIFYQVNDSHSSTYGGTGLGLSITKQLLTLLGGELSVKSKLNHGTEISFVIELKKGTKVNLPQLDEVICDNGLLKGKKILLVEDNEINSLLASAILENWEADITMAQNGREAIEKIEAQSFDLVLMDIRMPEMNGLEATKYIRQQLKSDVPIIAMSANALKGDAEAYIQVGMNDYIPKPFEENQLFIKICEQLKINTQNLVYKKVNQTIRADVLYSIEKLAKVAKGDEAFIKRMLNIFIKHMTETMMKLDTAYVQNDAGKIRDLAHQVAPSISDLCNPKVVNLIRTIEHEAEQGIMLKMEEHIQQFNKQMSGIIASIEAKELGS